MRSPRVEPTVWAVHFHADAVVAREHDILPRAEMRKVIERLESSPETCKPLQGALRGCFRHRVDDKRVVFYLDQAHGVVVIIAIGARRESEIYATAEKRR